MDQRFAYVGPEEIRKAAETQPEGDLVTSVDDLVTWFREHRTEAKAGAMWATYVIDTVGRLRIATRNSEHVACAGGRAVLGAGEIRFDDTGAVEEISNLSTGYCPASTCWSSVARALDAAHLEHPGGFTFAVEFRRCEECEQRNVIKDDWYYCAVCEAPLPASWNF